MTWTQLTVPDTQSPIRGRRVDAPSPSFLSPSHSLFLFYLYMFSSWLVPSLLHVSTPPSHNSSPCALCLTLSCSYLVSFTCFRWLIALSPSWPPFFLLCFCSTLLCSLHIYLLCVLFLPPSLLYASSLYGFLYLYPPEVGEKL